MMATATVAMTMLQQHLPFTVLKLTKRCCRHSDCCIFVATAPTVYGIETLNLADFPSVNSLQLQQHLPFTVLKLMIQSFERSRLISRCNSTYRLRYWNYGLAFENAPSTLNPLQQHLPFTVLKLIRNTFLFIVVTNMLQQHLPFTVLKREGSDLFYTMS